MSLKKFLLSVFTFVFLFQGQNSFAETKTATYYYGKGCPHCIKVEKFLKDKTSSFSIEKKEVYQNRENAKEFNDLCDKNNIKISDRGVPMFFIDGKYFVGDRDIIRFLKTEFNLNQTTEEKTTTTNLKQQLTMPMLIGAAIVDAINPCEFAVLIILMMTVLATGNRRRALSSGLAFSASIFLSYYLMGLGLYSIVSTTTSSSIFTKIIGWFSITIGLFNLKDFFWYGKGFLMEVPLSWRPKLKALIKSVTSPIGAFFIGLLVSLFLLPCTSGPYIVITSMLGQTATHSKALILLLLYNAIFVLPMILITIGAYFGLNMEKLEEARIKNLRFLHLIAGLIMLVMGIVIIS